MKIISCLLLLVCLQVGLYSCKTKSNLPFYNEIKEFKEADKSAFPPKSAIVFVGSSSIRLWENLSSHFPEHTIIQRGFGGSGLNDAIAYADDIITPYQPKQVVIYSGENDIAGGKVTANEVLEKFTQLFNKIRKEVPDAAIAYISMKPSPSREQYMPLMKESNDKIREFLSAHSKTAFIDIYHPMLGPDGKPRNELFVEDNLHMNSKGYEIWKAQISPHLVK